MYLNYIILDWIFAVECDSRKQFFDNVRCVTFILIPAYVNAFSTRNNTSRYDFRQKKKKKIIINSHQMCLIKNLMCSILC